MIILAADDEQPALDALTEAIALARPDAQLYPFRKTSELLDFASENSCDVAFLDIKMRGMTGIELAKKLKDICPNAEIIFVTGYDQYALEAFELHARGYLVKPVSAQMVRRELDNLNIPVSPSKSVIRAQTFGSFELFVNDIPVGFRRGRAKELLAYLIDRRGSAQTVSEIAAAMFEDRPYDRSLQKQMQVYISDLRSSLRQNGVEYLLIHRRNSLAVDISAMSCDYFDFLEMKPYAVRAYQGEYMTNYPWAELTLGWLERKNEM